MRLFLFRSRGKDVSSLAFRGDENTGGGRRKERRKEGTKKERKKERMKRRKGEEEVDGRREKEGYRDGEGELVRVGI